MEFLNNDKCVYSNIEDEEEGYIPFKAHKLTDGEFIDDDEKSIGTSMMTLTGFAQLLKELWRDDSLEKVCSPKPKGSSPGLFEFLTNH